MRVVIKAAIEDLGKSWLRDKEAITANVIDEARRLREAGISGRPATDKDIYLHFRKKLEAENPADADKDSFQVVDALMNGIHGKLPF